MTTTTTTRTTTTTTTTRTRTRTRRRARSNNNNNDNDDDNDDDDNEDAARSMSCPQVQMKSPSLFPSPDPYRHRRCAKLYNSAPPAPHEWLALRASVPERLELYGEARPKPPTLRRRAPKNTKNPSGGWGRAFWTESGSLISVSKSKIPPPPVWRVPKIGKKHCFDTFFGRFFAFRKSQNAVNYSIFCVLTSFAGAMQKRRKCCKYQYFLDPRCAKHCKYQCFWKPSKKTL